MSNGPKSMSGNEDHRRWIWKIIDKHRKDPKSVPAGVLRMAKEAEQIVTMGKSINL